VASIVSGLFGVAYRYLENRLSQKRERRQQLWRQKHEDIRELKYHANHLTEYLTGYESIEADSENLWESLEKIRDLKYRMREYPEILQALRDFRNTAGFRLREGKEYSSPEENKEALDEIENKYYDLIKACNRELENDRVR
jgi:DNA repair ATPase RecN